MQTIKAQGKETRRTYQAAIPFIGEREPDETRQLVDGFQIDYHETTVVAFNRVQTGPEEPVYINVLLNTGGWKTATTKRRINQAAKEFELGYVVVQRDGKWYVVVTNSKAEEEYIPMGDSILLRIEESNRVMREFENVLHVY